MDRIPYSKLAEHYDLGWGDFAESCQGFIDRTLSELGVGPCRILEMACGTGILATHLARLGHVVLGIDRSEAMISIARQRSQYVAGVEFEVADMRDSRPDSGFDVALCLFDSLNYLVTLEDFTAAIRSAAACLRVDGAFIFDVNCPLIYSAHDGETLRRRIEDGILTQEIRYDAADHIARTVFRFPDGDVETHVQRAYEPSEIMPLLAAAGLTLQDACSDFTGRPLSALSERAIFVCRKN